MSLFQDVANLAKIRITSMVMVTTALGYVLAKRDWEWGMIPCLVGTWLLAMGSAALNHWQDQRLDVQMERTKERPLPSGRMTSLGVLALAFLWSLLGAFLLGYFYSLRVLFLGLLALLWYNGVYTYGKRRTPFFVIPGSLIGALPPILGWYAGGAKELDLSILLVSLFLFIWQSPHFWMILLLHYKDYQVLWPQAPSREFFGRATVIGLFPTLLSAFAIPFFLSLSWGHWLVLLLASAALLWLALPLWRRQDPLHVRRAFLAINSYALVVFLQLFVYASL